jgi:hypothetical protein
MGDSRFSNNVIALIFSEKPRNFYREAEKGKILLRR